MDQTDLSQEDLDVARGIVAYNFLQPDIVTFVDEYKQSLASEWALTRPDDQATREAKYYELQALDNVMAYITHIANAAQIILERREAQANSPAPDFD